MKLKNWVLPIIVFGIFWGSIGAGMAAGVWKATQEDSSIKITSTDDLKGWMTLEDISGYLNVKQGELAKTLGIPATTDRNMQLKDIAAEKGVETDELKESLAGYFSDENGTEQNIKGLMSLLEVEKATGVPVKYICEKVGLPKDVDTRAPMRNLTGQFNFEVSEVRDAVASYGK